MEPGNVRRVSLCTRRAEPLGASFYLSTFGKRRAPGALVVPGVHAMLGGCGRDPGWHDMGSRSSPWLKPPWL